MLIFVLALVACFQSSLMDTPWFSYLSTLFLSSNRGSPFRRSTQEPSQNGGVAKRPPLPHRCNSADGSSRPPMGVVARGSLVERPPSQASIQSENNNVRVIGFSSPKTHFSSSHQDSSNIGESPSHYAIPRSALKLQMVPDFLQGKTDMGEYNGRERDNQGTNGTSYHRGKEKSCEGCQVFSFRKTRQRFQPSCSLGRSKMV